MIFWFSTLTQADIASKDVDDLTTHSFRDLLGQRLTAMAPASWDESQIPPQIPNVLLRFRPTLHLEFLVTFKTERNLSIWLF